MEEPLVSLLTLVEVEDVKLRLPKQPKSHTEDFMSEESQSAVASPF